MKYSNILTQILAVSAMTFLCSCERSEMPAGSISSRQIHPVVNAGQMTKAGGVQNLASLESAGFKMDIIAAADYEGGTAGPYGDTRTVTWSDPKWVFDEDAYWINNVQLDFWAYNIAASETCTISEYGAGATTMAFSYPKSGHTPDAQTDLLFAHAAKTHSSSNNHDADTDDDDMIDLTFKHALSKITFTKGTLTNVPAGYDINRISIIDIASAGECEFNSSDMSFTWTNLSKKASFDVSNVAWNNVTYDSDQYFIVIPQNAQNSLLQVTLSHSTKEPIVLTKPMANYDMKAGKIYNYKINVTLSGEKDLDLTLSVADWNLESRSIEIDDPDIYAYLNIDTYYGGLENVAPDKIYIQDGKPITGLFQLTSPKGAKLLLALDGNLDAFEVSPKFAYIGNDPINFSITPLVDDPKIEYQTRLHIYLVNSDATVSPLDEMIMRENDAYKHYTIVLPAQ